MIEGSIPKKKGKSRVAPPKLFSLLGREGVTLPLPQRFAGFYVKNEDFSRILTSLK
jgi:hypothetical protein